MKKRSFWMFITGLLLLYLIISFFIPVHNTQNYPSATSYSPLPDGLKALYTLLREPPAMGAIRITTEPQTTGYITKTTLMIQPSSNLSSSIVSDYLAQIRLGMHLLLLTNQKDALTVKLGIPLHYVAYTPSKPSLQKLYGMKQPIKITRDPIDLTTLKAKATDHIFWLVMHHHHDTIGLTRRIGLGSITIFTDPSIAYNQSIAKAQNLVFLLHVLAAQNQRIGFIETVHGYEITPGILAIYGAPMTAFLVFLVLFVLVFLFAKGRRFGEPITVLSSPPTASLAFAKAIAKHQRKRKDWISVHRAFTEWLEENSMNELVDLSNKKINKKSTWQLYSRIQSSLPKSKNKKEGNAR